VHAVVEYSEAVSIRNRYLSGYVLEIFDSSPGIIFSHHVVRRVSDGTEIRVSVFNSTLATTKSIVYSDGIGTFYTGDMGDSFAVKGFAALRSDMSRHRSNPDRTA